VPVGLSRRNSSVGRLTFDPQTKTTSPRPASCHAWRAASMPLSHAGHWGFPRPQLKARVVEAGGAVIW